MGLGLFMFFVVAAAATLSVSPSVLAWIVEALALVGVYQCVASLSGRWTLRVEGRRIELRRTGLPSLRVQSRDTVSRATTGQWALPEPIPVTEAHHIQLVARQWRVGEDGQTRAYYGVGVLDQAGDYAEYGISTDLDVARFVYQVLCGHEPQALAGHTPAALEPASPDP